MAELNETPRQKMMGILYLVLLGLAATTVTDHVLDAFHNLTESLETSSKNVQTTVANTFASFEAKNLKNDAVRAKPIYDRAVKVKTSLDSLNGYITSLRSLLEKEGDGVNPETGDVNARASTDISPRVMIEQGRAKILKKKINDTRQEILSNLSKTELDGIKLSLNADDPKKKEGVKISWEEENFGDGIPLTAAITALTKIQADIKNTENEVIRKILGEANEVDIVMDKYTAVAIPKSTVVLVGQPYEATVFLTAHSSSANPEISVGGQKLNVEDGKGLYTASTSSPGEKKWTGEIRITKTDGTTESYKTEEQSYMVEPPTAVVSPTKMNVFYIGLDNPISISAPGFTLDKVKPSISAGSISGGTNGNYVVRVSKPGMAVITITGEMEKGKTVSLGKQEFRCKAVPPPRIKFGAQSAGSASTVVLKSQKYLFAKLDDFEFDTKFEVKHFRMIIIKARGGGDAFNKETDGSVLSPEMLSELSKITPGSRIIFDYIKVLGPDGVTKQLNDAPTFLAQ